MAGGRFFRVGRDLVVILRDWRAVLTRGSSTARATARGLREGLLFRTVFLADALRAFDIGGPLF